MKYLRQMRTLAFPALLSLVLLAATVAIAPPGAAQPTASISNYTWADENGNGIQDFGEIPIGGVTIRLWSDDGAGQPDAVLDTTSSSNLGLYVFGALVAGTYHVEFVSPAGMMPTIPNQGGDPEADSSPDPATGFTPPIVIADGDTNTGIDAGFVVADPFASGDVSCDGVVSLTDALYIAQYAIGGRPNDSDCPLGNPANELSLANGDVDGSGLVNISDALLIAQCEVGISNVACP